MSSKILQHAEAARTLLATARCGMLATTSVAAPGYPFGSITPYIIDGAGRITIYISLIAEHYRNLKADSRASILAADPFGGSDPQAHARATVLLTVQPVPDDERAAVSAAYEARFPQSINYEIAHNFVFMRGEPERVRWIGGFGEMSWIDRAAFQSARPDPLAESALDIVTHMNEDHADALVDIVRGLTEHDPAGSTVTMTGISSSAITVRLSRRDHAAAVSIPFPEPIGAADARGAVIALLKKAREKTT